MRRGGPALLVASASLALAACVNPALIKVTYDSPVTRTSEKSASIHVTTGIVEMQSLAYFRTSPRQYFNLDDQQVFAQSLKDELNRLRVLRVGEISWQDVVPADVSIEIVFQRTTYFPGIQRYFLDVAMRLRSGERSFARRYQVRSAEGESFWASINTDAGEGKALAAKKLLARLIPDIEAFVAGSP